MRKFILSFFTFIIFVFVAIAAIFYCVTSINPFTLEVHYETISSDKIPDIMDNVSIVYISDLQFGDHTPLKIIEKTFDKISSLQPDIFIYGGDLFDYGYSPTEESFTELETLFNNVEAPLGKFAIYGEKDLTNGYKEKIDSLYFNSDVEIVDNQIIRIGNHSKKGIRFIGLTDSTGVDTCFESTSNNEFNLVLTHQPDVLLSEKFLLSPTDYALAAHSHGTQISYPVVGGYKTVEGSNLLNRSNMSPLAFPYYITSGIGCTEIQARFNAPCEVCYFVLRKS